jgi:RNA binding exosome subunit
MRFRKYIEIQVVNIKIAKEDKDKWVTAIKSAIGYANLFDFYELKVQLHFGNWITLTRRNLEKGNSVSFEQDFTKNLKRK